MSSLHRALQHTSYDPERTCPACGRSDFKSAKGVLSHMSQAKGCRWYRKGKLRDLGILDAPESEPVVGGEEDAAEENEYQGDLWDPQDVMDELHHELFDLIPVQPPPDPAPSPEDPACHQGPQPGPSRRMLDLSDDRRVVIEHPTAGRVVRMAETLHLKWRRYFLGEEERDVDDMGDVVMGDVTGAAFSNKYAPFASETDWHIAQWAVLDGVGHNSLDRLLAIPGVSLIVFVGVLYLTPLPVGRRKAWSFFSQHESNAPGN